MQFSFINSLNTKNNKVIEGMGVCVLGMGDCGSSSKSSIEVTNNVLQVDKKSIELMNEQVNNLIVNEMQEQSKNCGGGVYNNNDIEIVGLDVEKDINIDVEQSNEAFVSFSCVQGTDIVSNVSRNMISSMMTDLNSNTNQDAISKMAAVASSEQTQGFGSLLNPPSNSDSNIKFNNNYQQLSENNKKIINKVANSLEKNFTAKTIDDCVSTVNNNNSFKLKDAKSNSGGAKLLLKQKNAASLISQCIQKSNIANKISESLTNAFDVKTVDTLTQKATSESEATAESKSENRGPLESLGSFFGSLFSNVGAIIFSVIVFILIMVGVFFVFKMKTGKMQAITELGQNADQGMDSDEFMSGGYFLTNTEFISNLIN